jgi:cyclomaltodextrinase / maltogenic alpha-amylase / neopullulanase
MLRLLIHHTAIFLMVVSAAAPAPGQSTRPASSQAQFVPDWITDAIFYQIFPERFANGDTTNDPPGTIPWGRTPTPKNYFGGDLRGIREHLDYVASLGVNTLYLNPIFTSNSNHKYHADDYMSIDPAFGNDEEFKALVDACHQRGIRIILDGVFNHSGTGLFAFKDIKEKGEKSRYVKWYNIYSFPVGPPDKPNYECWWGYGDLPKLMTGNPEVRKYIFDVTAKWMSFGIDGWRLDVPNEVPHAFWIDWRKHVKQLNPEAYIVGEIWDDAQPWLQGDQFDGVMNYQLRAACLNFFVRETTSAFQFDTTLRALRRRYTDQVNCGMQNLLGSHDTERLLTLCQGDREKMKLAWVFLMTYIGAPMVYYGDEIGMEGGKDPACRGTMVWDKQKQDTSLLENMRGLIAVRRELSALRHGDVETLAADSASRCFIFARKDGDDAALVILNNELQSTDVTVKCTGALAGRSWTLVWPRQTSAGVLNNDILKITVPPRTGLIFSGGRQGR